MTLMTPFHPDRRMPALPLAVEPDHASGRVAGLMTPGFETLALGTTLREAARRFDDSGASELFVLGSDGRYVGTLLEADLIRALLPPSRLDSDQAGDRLLDNGRSRRDDRVDALVVRDVPALAPDDDLLRAADILVMRQLRRLPVVADGVVIGSVSRTEVCRTLFGG